MGQAGGTLKLRKLSMTPFLGITLIPFFQNAQDIVFLFYILARVSGFFFLSPLFRNRNIPSTVRIGLLFFVTALLCMVLYPSYRSESPRYYLPELHGDADHLWIVLAVGSLKELAVGYVMGFAFSLLFEVALLAGQVLSNLAGLSAAQLVDPIMNSQTGLISQLFNITFILLFLSLDLHLETLKFLESSFHTLPIGNYHLPHELLQEINHGTGRIFHYALRLAAIPFVVLSLVTVSLGFMARVMPEMNIFLVGFPLKILLSFYSLTVAIKFFPILFNPLFQEFYTFARLITYRLATG